MDEERDALQQIRSSINSPQGTAFSSWYGEACCQWEGVECNPSTTRVIRISFRHRRDQSLPELWYPNATLFAQFKDLQELKLPGNQIGGFISPNELARLKQLQKIDVHDNSIEVGSHLCWGKIPPLRFLDLSRNKLQGNIPKCMCENPHVKELFLSDNFLIGNVDGCLRNMTSLKYLDLSHNSFNGSFPSLPISNLTNIQSVILSRNEFKDRISLSHFANLSRLSLLDISWNSLEVETESITWIPSFNLSMLNLAACNLKTIPNFISSQRHLESIDLSYNSLTGKIPSWMLDNVSKELQLSGNGFTGPFPKSFQNSSQLTRLDISDNTLSGSLSEDIGLDFPELRYLNASCNSFIGRLPPSFDRMKELIFLELSRNQFHGEIPYSMTSNMSSLEYLGLSRNNLTGDALPNNSSLPNLRYLYLGRNHFIGIFPDSLRESRDLLLLDLTENSMSGGIPKCIDNITSWTENSPHQFPRHSLGLYRNIYLVNVMDLSCNRLTGTIPVQMTQLDLMQALNLSNNRLTGQIPATFGNMRLLEALDLSQNNLLGKLPRELSALAFLAAFDVSFNNLSGRIPLGPQLSAFSSESYMGNSGLCGIPLTNNCDEVLEKSSPPSGICGLPLEKECDKVLEKSSCFFPNKATSYTLLLLYLCAISLLFSD
ncbi:hypothetical protein SLEP1_g4799 [Rubroshorea leprosula]|uniref:Leucine-rich repeat-containing N-terminal plant-type domain-containing protein n=1 Tax=Rubroshorea leprosula TaxID=152421 RepID=A0AAV5HVP1_9ROSI|nr:hypothetical protein SLEP1_g4799 [Rubroshorea leprosula]